MLHFSRLILASAVILVTFAIPSRFFGEPKVDAKSVPVDQLSVGTLQKWCSMTKSIRKCPMTCTGTTKVELVDELHNAGIYKIPDSSLRNNPFSAAKRILNPALPCPQFKIVNTDKLKMYYLLWKPAAGSPPKTPIVLLGGWTAVKEDWVDVATAWTAAPLSRTILTVDIRGVGQTGLGPTAGNYTVPQISRDIGELIQQVFPNQKVFVIGGALGGKWVLQLAIDYPNMFEAIIPASTTAGGSLTVPGPRRASFFELVLTGQFRIRLYQYAQAIFSPEWAKNNVLTWLGFFLRGALYSRPQEGILRTANIALFSDLSGEVDKVNQPTLCLHGSDDAIALPASSQRLCAAIGANARFEELTNEGHAFWFQDPAELIKDAEVFFASCCGQ